MQTIAVFQQNGSAETKIKGIRQFCGNRIQIRVVDVEPDLPPVLDDTSAFLPDRIDADLVLDFLRHYDLSEDLGRLCEKQGIPMVSSGKKLQRGHAFCPPICCTLQESGSLGEYGRRFGMPRITVEQDDDGRIQRILVHRGAPCGATWLAADKVRGLPLDEAMTRFGLEVQFFCSANPAGWDPLWGKSPVHLAADVHTAALKTSLKKNRVLSNT